MEERGVPNKHRCTIGTGKNSLASFEIFNTKAGEIKRVILELAYPVACKSMKSIDDHLEIEVFHSWTKGRR